MPKTFSVQIPTSPYLKHFICKEFGHPIQINNQSLIGVFMIGILEKQNFHVHMPQEQKNYRYLYFTEKITCIAPLSLIRNFGFTVKEDHVIQLNRFFEEYFDHELYLYVKRNTKQGHRYAGYKQAIESFAALYHIVLEETISFEALKKMEYRYRIKKENKSVDDLSSPVKQAASLF